MGTQGPATLEAIRYKRGSLELLEQRELPQTTRYLSIQGTEDVWTAIRDMSVRGAPAIAIAAMLGLAVELVRDGGGTQFADARQALTWIEGRLDYLVSSRPTAVNLSQAAAALQATAAAALAATAGEDGPGSAAAVVQAVVSAAEAMLADDIAANRALGAAGAEALVRAVQAKRDREDAVPGAPARSDEPGLHVLTHCNTGSLATAGYGTALGVVRALRERGLLLSITATETRPYNQGARLTAYEIQTESMPGCLIVDSAAPALMAAGRVDAVVVGADRVAANGDTANKVGTYALAVAAAHHGIPFFVAAPTTTLDPDTPAGADIIIEQRDPTEVTHFRGHRVAADVPVWNPSFDVTPATLIAAIITERGVLYPAKQAEQHQIAGPLVPRFDVPAFLRAGDAGVGDRDAAESAAAGQQTGVHTATEPQAGIEPLGTEGVRAYVLARPSLAARLGVARDTAPEAAAAAAAEWDIREVGDGNINFVYIVRSSSRDDDGRAVCLKQSLPFVRMVGPDWPLAQERQEVEAEALRVQADCCPAHVPQVYNFDPENAVLAMQFIPPPHAILRGALVRGEVFPALGEHLSQFLASTLFRTSYWALDADAFEQQVARFANRGMCELTEQVIFTDPFYAAPHNRAEDGLDVSILRRPAARAAATALRQAFVARPQALLHGDFHTGSIMVTPESTYVIDPEFAFYGPMGFDLGKGIANLLLACIAAPGHGLGEARATEQQRWLLAVARQLLTGFLTKFRELWAAQEPQGPKGMAPGMLFPSADSLRPVMDAFLDGVAVDAARFAGAVMVRRIVGIARVLDFESIQDAALKLKLETEALQLGYSLLVGELGLLEAMNQLQAVLA